MSLEERASAWFQPPLHTEALMHRRERVEGGGREGEIN